MTSSPSPESRLNKRAVAGVSKVLDCRRASIWIETARGASERWRGGYASVDCAGVLLSIERPVILTAKR
jgi:hypothetical protein